jgi:hypothetical protein
MKSLINVLKRPGWKKNAGMENKTARGKSQLLKTNFTGAGRKDLLKGTCTKGDKGYVGKA